MRIIRRAAKYYSLIRYLKPQNVDYHALHILQPRLIKDRAIPELNKYGFMRYTHQFRFKLYPFCALALVCGAFFTNYMYSLWYNQHFTLDYRKPIEVYAHAGSIWLRCKLIDMMIFIESRLFLGDIYSWVKGTDSIDLRTEAILRTLQYRNFMKNKDRRADFTNIGIMEIYPFPKFNAADLSRKE